MNNQSAPADPLLTLNEVATNLDVSRATVERLIRAGRLRALKLGHLTRVRQSDQNAFLAALPAAEYRQAA